VTPGSASQIARRAVLLAAVWLILTAADPGGIAVGLVAVTAATWLSARLRPPHAPPLRPLRALILLPRFLWRSFLGGVDVARRAFDPRMPLAPGWFVVPARIPEGGPRVILGGEFSLLPCTLVAGTRGESYLVHVLDRNGDIAGQFAQGEDELVTVLGEVRR